MAADLTGAAVAKRLASCCKATRDRALRHLQTWLSSSADAVTDAEFLKIWKGLFYCVWHADKLPVQVELINHLSSLLVSLPLPIAARYFGSFLATIRHEWGGIDILRLDKFYLLIRRFVRQFFAFMSNNSWDREVVVAMVGVLSEKTLLSVDGYAAQGVNYHISQVFLDEILGFLPVGKETIDSLLKPFVAALETTPDRVLVSKIKGNVFGRLLESGIKYVEIEKKGGGLESGSEVEKLGKIALAIGFSKLFFDSARSPETLQGNRKVLFGLHNGFMKLEKNLENLGIKVSLEQENGYMGNADASDCTGLVEEDVEKHVEYSNGKCSKKRKKSKKSSGDCEKKMKGKKNKKSSDIVEEDNERTLTPAANGSIESEEQNADAMDYESSMLFDEAIMSNLQKQFEKVAAEAGMVTPVVVPKKRKKSKSAYGKVSSEPATCEISEGKTTTEMSVKRVRFSMKNNLVWKPHSPLPPQNLRLPPSVTPRGSALKKGIPPGPVRETPQSSKKAKAKVNSLKKGRKSVKSISPAIKRLRKLKSSSL